MCYIFCHLKVIVKNRSQLKNRCIVWWNYNICFLKEQNRHCLFGQVHRAPGLRPTYLDVLDDLGLECCDGLSGPQVLQQVDVGHSGRHVLFPAACWDGDHLLRVTQSLTEHITLNKHILLNQRSKGWDSSSKNLDCTLLNTYIMY